MGNLLLLFGKFLVESPSTLYGWFQKIYPLLPILQCNSWNDESILFEKRYLYSHSYNDCSNRSTSFVHCILPYTNDSKNELSLLILENSPFNMMVLRTYYLNLLFINDSSSFSSTELPYQMLSIETFIFLTRNLFSKNFLCS